MEHRHTNVYSSRGKRKDKVPLEETTNAQRSRRIALRFL